MNVFKLKTFVVSTWCRTTSTPRKFWNCEIFRRVTPRKFYVWKRSSCRRDVDWIGEGFQLWATVQLHTHAHAVKCCPLQNATRGRMPSLCRHALPKERKAPHHHGHHPYLYLQRMYRHYVRTLFSNVILGLSLLYSMLLISLLLHITWCYNPHAVQYLKLCRYFYIVFVHFSVTVYFGFEFLIRNSSDLSPYIWQWTGLHYRSPSCWYDHLLTVCYAFMLVIVFIGRRPMLSVRCPVCLSVCLWRWCIVAKWLDGSRWNLACR